MMNSSNSGSDNSAGGNNSSAPQDIIRILIVDDQKMIREGLKALLKIETDLEVVGIAENGENALKQVETLKPDVVLMDMEMPGMDGMAATQAICQKFQDVKILVLSTYDTQESQQALVGDPSEGVFTSMNLEGEGKFTGADVEAVARVGQTEVGDPNDPARRLEVLIII